uniref:hypothetical protein n=1 Tax=Treponema endosymbiont of Eucomonympha sp. TaxID=1580831 RepID=UPI000B127D78
KFNQTFLDTALGAGYTVEFGSSQARLGVDLFHAMDLTQNATSSRLYIAPQLHYGYSFANIPLTLGAGAEWDIGLGLEAGANRGRGGAGRIFAQADDSTKPTNNPYFWLDASYQATEKVSFGLSVGADINEPVKTYAYHDDNDTRVTSFEEYNSLSDAEKLAYSQKVHTDTFKHTSLSFPIKLGVTFR